MAFLIVYRKYNRVEPWYILYRVFDGLKLILSYLPLGRLRPFKNLAFKFSNSCCGFAILVMVSACFTSVVVNEHPYDPKPNSPGLNERG